MKHLARELTERAGVSPTLAQSREHRGTAFRRGFTLVETMVAVGALALVATGIAVIFETTGRTVSTGRRISAFNTYAAAIEQRLKADISSMTREGFLVIRNEHADPSGNGTVDPTPTDRQPAP